jgi:hypothetical protein
MKNALKLSGFLSLLLLFVGSTAMSMDQMPLIYTEIKKDICNFPPFQIQGEIVLSSGVPVGFCAKEDVERLNKIGIQANENTPFVAIEAVWVKDPKKNEEGEDVYSNWLQGVPVILSQHCTKHINEKIKEKSQDMLDAWKQGKSSDDNISEMAMQHGEKEARSNLAQCTFPSVLPVMTVLHRSERILLPKLFGFCDVSLGCDREGLFDKIDAFNESPGIIIPFDSATIKKMNVLEESEDVSGQNKLAKSIMNASLGKIDQTEQQLVGAGIVSSSQRQNEKKPTSFSTTCLYYNVKRNPGPQFPDIRKDTLQDNFPKKNVFKALQARELGYK